MLPDTASAPSDRSYEYGGVTSYERTLRWLAGYIPSLFAKSEEWSFFVEDAWAEASDLVLPGSQVASFLCKSTVVRGVNKSEFESIGILNLLRHVSSFYSIGLASAVHISAVNSRSCLTKAKWQPHAVENPRAVLATAFDGEGVVLHEMVRFLNAAARAGSGRARAYGPC